MIEFEAGKTYWSRMTVDYDLVERVTITRRTAKSVWIANADGTESRCKIHTYAGVERIMPFGTYSMATVISADKIQLPA